MRIVAIGMVTLLFQGIAFSGEIIAQSPMRTITGHYRVGDGRVKDHIFPVEIKLLSNGKFTGTSESWIEERLTNGRSELIYFSEAFSGSWLIKDKTIFIAVEEGALIHDVTFNEMNGLKITITKKKS